MWIGKMKSIARACRKTMPCPYRAGAKTPFTAHLFRIVSSMVLSTVQVKQELKPV